MCTHIPTLIIGYNRRDLLQRQVETCKNLGRQFFLALDGPKSKEDYLALETLSYAKELMQSKPINLLGTLIRETNLGCKLGVSTAISWAFSHCNSLIILEDDVEVDSRFFDFMDFALPHFQEDSEVFLVNGWSPLSNFGHSKSEFNYYFQSAFLFASGWATWSDRWALVDLNLEKFRDNPTVYHLPTVQKQRLGILLTRVMSRKFRQCLRGLDTWDYQILYTMWRNGCLAITPLVRLTGNLGFDLRATHTVTAPVQISPELWKLPTQEASLSQKKDWKLLDQPKRSRNGFDLLIGEVIFGVYSGRSLITIFVHILERFSTKSILRIKLYFRKFMR
jgi:GR25 family glycosyltransferase involved in LPS biosynthesis